jgi:hypothetical protein
MELVVLLAGASAMETEHYPAYAASMPAVGPAQANASGARAVGPKDLLRPMSALCADDCKEGSLRTGKPTAGPQVRRGDIGEYDAPGGGSHALQHDTSTTDRSAPKYTDDVRKQRRLLRRVPGAPFEDNVNDAMRAGTGDAVHGPPQSRDAMA